MQINLPSNVDALVQQKAAAAGFGDDVAAYVAHLIQIDPSPALTSEQIATSEALLQRGEADLAAGRFQDMREAMANLGETRGYSHPE